MTAITKQGLEPLLCNDPRILILGSLPGDISIERQEYYANPKNFFWKIIATITGSPMPFSYQAKKEMLAKNHIALWDVYASAERPGSSDSKIRGGEFNDIAGFVTQYELLFLPKHKPSRPVRQTDFRGLGERMEGDIQ